MTDRITKHVSAMKEYGRKPYLVTADAIPYGEKADYRYMMDTTWHKAQDNEQIVVQSVKKKPYQNSDYQAMEQGYDFPIFTFPRWNFQFDFPNTIYRRKPNSYPTEPTEPTETQTQATGLRWIQCPTSVSASKTYTIIVQNSGITTRNLIGGRLNGTSTTYFPSSFELVKAVPYAKGFSIYNLIDKGSTTWITLTISSTAIGSFYLYATDGNNRINRTIGTSSAYGAVMCDLSTNAYIYLVDPFGTPGIWEGTFILPITDSGGSDTPADPNYTTLEYGTDKITIFAYHNPPEIGPITLWLDGIHKGTPYSYFLVIDGVTTAEGFALLAVGDSFRFAV